VPIELLVGLVAAGIRLGMSIGIAAIGESIAQRSGVLNVGIEGIMLVGAFLGAYGAVATGSPWGGLGLALAGGALLAAVHAFFCITLRADQVVSGIALVILGLGLSSFLFRITLGRTPTRIPNFTALDLGPLSAIPVIGPILFGQNVLVYLGVALAIALTWILRRTAIGLEIRACGDDPDAARASGVAVTRRRYASVVFGGALAGMGGAYLSLAQVNAFVENMVAGRGFIAVACVVFGRWNPLAALGVAFAFGLIEAAQIRLQPFFPGVPYQFFVMLPYVLAVVVLAFLAHGAALPRALGQRFPA
jgi:general nucleoside transport system permease protein